MKNYILDPDPTLRNMRLAILIIWAVTAGCIVAIFSQPNITPWLKPIHYPLNGAIFNSEYVPGEITNNLNHAK